MFVLNTWYIAAWTEDVTDKPFPRRICNEAIVFFRDKQSGKVAALADVPHLACGTGCRGFSCRGSLVFAANGIGGRW